MTRPTLALVLFALLAANFTGCGSSASKRLIGKWELDVEAMKDTEAPAAALLMLSSANMTIEFKSDGTAVGSVNVVGKTETETAEWKVLDSEGDAATILVAAIDKDSKGQMEVRFIDDDTLEISSLGQHKMPGVDVLIYRRVH